MRVRVRAPGLLTGMKLTTTRQLAPRVSRARLQPSVATKSSLSLPSRRTLPIVILASPLFTARTYWGFESLARGALNSSVEGEITAGRATGFLRRRALPPPAALCLDLTPALGDVSVFAPGPESSSPPVTASTITTTSTIAATAARIGLSGGSSNPAGRDGRRQNGGDGGPPDGAAGARPGGGRKLEAGGCAGGGGSDGGG